MLGSLLLIVHVVGGPVVAGEPSDVDAGRQVFDAHCARCHGQDARGMGGHPSLRGAVERLGREAVEVTIRDGRDTRPPMPAFGGRLSQAQIAAVTAYLDTLPSRAREPGRRGDGADRPGGGGPMMDGGMMVAGPVMLLMGLLVLAVMVLAVAAVVWLVRQTGGGTASRSSAREELDRRYAAGQIDRDDYLQRRRDLEG